jgi:hypothetical protein
MCVFVFVCALL